MDDDRSFASAETALASALGNPHARDSDRWHGVALRPWEPTDLGLLHRLLGDPAMTEYLGGPEARDAIDRRHDRYLHMCDASGQVFAVTTESSEAAGWVGFWESSWRGETVWECGWSILPEYQRHGVATTAAALMIDIVRERDEHRFLHAFPGVKNGASNAVCERLGFTCLGEADVEYPPGRFMRCNDWQLDVADQEARSGPTPGG